MENHKITRLLICNSRYIEITCINIDGNFISGKHLASERGEKIFPRKIVQARAVRISLFFRLFVRQNC